MYRADGFPDPSMAVLYHLVLLLHGTLAFSAMAPYKSHAVHIHAETEDDKAEHDGKEGLGVLVGEVLHIGCKPVQTALANLLPASTSFSYLSLYWGSSLSGIFSPIMNFFQLPMAVCD